MKTFLENTRYGTPTEAGHWSLKIVSTLAHLLNIMKKFYINIGCLGLLLGLFQVFFPCFLTCQVRVIRSLSELSSPPPPPPDTLLVVFNMDRGFSAISMM